MARWPKVTASLTAIAFTLTAIEACSGSSEVSFHDAGSGRGASGGAAGQGASAGNDGSGGASGISGANGSGGAGGTNGTAGADGSAGLGGTSGSAGRGGTSGSAGRGGTSGSAGRGGTSGSAGRGGTNGSAGTAGTSGTAGTNGASGAPDGGTCPSTVPNPSSPCAPNGLSCSYGDCCPVTATCSGGGWQVITPPCVPPVCPASSPRNGDSCDPCRDATQCRYDRCDGGDGVAVASCNGQTKRWQVLVGACESPCRAQGMSCDPDEICVRRSGGAGFNYSCEDNPCGSNPVTCQCAAPACGGDPWVCSSANDQLVTCSCLTCT
jgi:hypothetical protein